jgi:uncharacterized protein
MFAQHFIDSLDFARKGREMQGEVQLAEMPRLQDKLAVSEGKISFVVRGMQDKNGLPMLELTLNGLCQLRCQRCLGELAYPVQLHSCLRLAQAGELDEFSVDEDEQESITADPRLDVLALLEEEILLSLPFAPAHPVGACQPLMKGSDRSERSPFAVLAGLKGK